MNLKSIAAIAFIAASVASCQNAGYLMDTYNKVGKQVVQTPGGSFWVFDRPDLHKILTTPGPGTIAGPAILGGATFGLVNVDPELKAHQFVALKYLTSTGRTCELKTSFEIWRPEYEHTYTCK